MRRRGGREGGKEKGQTMQTARRAEGKPGKSRQNGGRGGASSTRGAARAQPGEGTVAATTMGDPL